MGAFGFVRQPTRDMAIDLIQRAIEAALNVAEATLRSLSEPEVRVVAGDWSMTSENVVEYNGSGSHTIRLPAASSIPGRRSRPRYVINNSAAAITLAAAGGDTIDNGAAVTLGAGAVAVLAANGATRTTSLMGVAGGVLRALLNGTGSVPGGVHIYAPSVPTNRNLLQVETELGKVLEIRTGSTLIGHQINVRGLVVFPGATSGAEVTVQLIGDQRMLQFGTTNNVKVGNAVYTEGLSIGTAAADKIGFHDATPIAQGAAIADATDGASAIARLNDLLAHVRARGFIAT